MGPYTNMHVHRRKPGNTWTKIKNTIFYPNFILQEFWPKIYPWNIGIYMVIYGLAESTQSSGEFCWAYGATNWLL